MSKYTTLAPIIFRNAYIRMLVLGVTRTDLQRASGLSRQRIHQFFNDGTEANLDWLSTILACSKKSLLAENPVLIAKEPIPQDPLWLEITAAAIKDGKPYPNTVTIQNWIQA